MRGVVHRDRALFHKSFLFVFGRCGVETERNERRPKRVRVLLTKGHRQFGIFGASPQHHDVFAVSCAPRTDISHDTRLEDPRENALYLGERARQVNVSNRVRYSLYRFSSEKK